MKTVADVLGVARSNLVEQIKERSPRRLGRPPLLADDLVAEIKAVIADLPTYGYAGSMPFCGGVPWPRGVSPRTTSAFTA